MSDFTPIETQEQLDKVIGERIRRAEQKAAEKYADYEDLKTQNAGYVTQISQLQTQLQAQADKAKESETSIADLTAKVHQYETASVKTKVALEIGLPYQMASRLTGDDEKAIRADAEAMKQLIGAQVGPAPLGSTEPSSTKGGSGTGQLWAAVASQMSEQ
jgi:chromosome segregation ATPase